MARIKKSRTLTLSDEVFDGLQALAEYRRYKGDKQASASKIIEALAAEYLKGYQREISLVRDNRAEFERSLERQISLFDVDADGNFSFTGAKDSEN